MIIAFGLKGYRSYQKFTFLDMYSNNKLNEFSESLLGREKLLPITALYGANGAGKSNLLDCIFLMKKILLGNAKLDESLKNSSSELEMQIEILIDDTHFIYSFEYSNKSKKFISEHFAINNNGVLHTIYKIENTSLIEITDKTLTAQQRERIQMYLEDSESENLVISKIWRLKLFNKSSVSKFLNYFETKIINLSFSDNIRPIYTSLRNISKSKRDNKDVFIETLKKFDYDIVDLIEEQISEEDFRLAIPSELFEKINDAFDEKASELFISSPSNQFLIKFDKKVKFYKYLYRIKYVESLIEFSELSDGTKSIVNVLDRLINSYDSCIVIDEIERSYHPIILEQLVKFMRINSRKNKNQFIFSTHSTTIMNLKFLRRDEINLCLKKEASTEIINFNEFIIRKDTSIEKNYLNGRYGAIPNVSSFLDGDQN